MLRTPLYPLHAAAGARFVPFSGWEMPVQYTSILEEHRRVRRSAGLFDVSHMGEALVTGPGAAAFLDHVATNHVATLPDGKAVYTVLCHPTGGVVDDVIITRLAADKFFICLNAGNAAKDLDWLRAHVGEFDAQVHDQCADWAQLALQGPLANAILTPLLPAPDHLPGRFRVRETTVAGIPVMVSRTGYTGEDGVELYVAADRGCDLAAALLAAGGDRLGWVGLGARDSLRLEAGYPLYGHEIDDAISPLEAGLGWVVKLAKPAFIGRDALAAEHARGPARKLVHFTLGDRRIARAGTPVLDATGATVGEVRSGTLSPILEEAIGSALVAASADPAALSVDLRGNRLPLKVRKAPLHVAAAS